MSTCLPAAQGQGVAEEKLSVVATVVVDND